MRVPLWIRAAVQGLGRTVTGVVSAERGVGMRPRRHGFTPQRPARRADQQNQAKVTFWLEEEYLAIATRYCKIAARYRAGLRLAALFL